MEAFLSAWPVLCSAEAVAAHEATYPSRRDEYGPWFRDWLDPGGRRHRRRHMRVPITSEPRAMAGYVRYSTLLTRLRAPRCLRATLRDYHARAYPRPLDDGLDMSLLRFTAPFDFNGAPTISVQCGLNSEGLPLSLQFVAKHLEEKLLCRIGHAYELATEWHAVHRPCSDGRKEPGWPCTVGSVLGRHRLRSRCHADDPDGLQIEQCRTGLRRWNQRVPSAPRRWLRVSDGIKQLEGECFCPDSLVHRLKSYAFDRKLDRDDRIFGIGRIRAWQIHLPGIREGRHPEEGLRPFATSLRRDRAAAADRQPEGAADPSRALEPLDDHEIPLHSHR